jgi:phosphoketolase
VFDNPDLIVACVVGDGEAETGPLATAWHSNKFLDPVDRRRGAADPAPERLQDQQSDRARAHQHEELEQFCAATAGRRTSSRATSPS